MRGTFNFLSFRKICLMSVLPFIIFMNILTVLYYKCVILRGLYLIYIIIGLIVILILLRIFRKKNLLISKGEYIIDNEKISLLMGKNYDIMFDKITEVRAEKIKVKGSNCYSLLIISNKIVKAKIVSETIQFTDSLEKTSLNNICNDLVKACGLNQQEVDGVKINLWKRINY